MNKGLIYYATVYTPIILIINLGLGSQQDPVTISGMPLNQIINWIVILGASIVITNIFRSSVWPTVIIVGIIFSKLASVLGDYYYLYIIYKVSLLSLFWVLGIIYFYRYRDLLYKQVLIFGIFNLLMMIFQILNLGDWTQFLSTESTFKHAQKITYDILFADINHLQYSVIQARPSGFLRSNNILSGVLIFAMALHFSRDKERLLWGSIVLIAMMVLASARIVYTGYVLMVLLMLFMGNRVQKNNILITIVTLVFLLLVYYFFFPGLFINFWTFDTFFYNFYIRLNDIMSVFDRGSIPRKLLGEFLVDTPTASWDTEEGLSGYTLLAKYLPYLIVLLFLFVPLYIKYFRIQNKIFPHLRWVTSLCLIFFIFYPAAVPILRDQFYWFAGGFALSPLFLLFPIKTLKELFNQDEYKNLNNYFIQKSKM